MKLYHNLDLLQNFFNNAVTERLASFPAGARKGRIIFHTGFNDLFVCKNGFEEGADTTKKGNWVGGKVTIDGLSSENIDRGKILVTDGTDGFIYDDCDGGTL